VIDSGAIRPLVDLVNNDLTDKEVRSEACWVVLNATSCGNDTQISILIEEGCVSVLGVLLTEPNMVMMALEGIERVLQTEEARDSEDLYHASEEELGQRPTIMKCASLIKTVVAGGSPHGNASSAVSKRARRIWDHHFVSCALCHNNYSRCRLRDSHFCNECKCHVCSKCDCRVYHLSYQEELWKEDEEKDKERGKAKKSKKAKKKQKAKERQQKLAEKKAAQAQQPPQYQLQPPLKAASSRALLSAAASPGEGKGSPSSETTEFKNNQCTFVGEPSEPSSRKGGADKQCILVGEPPEPSSRKVSANKEANIDKGKPTTTHHSAGRKKSTSASPSRDTIASGETTTDSLLGSGGAEISEANSTLGSGGESNNGAQPPIDLVQYLQQTGSIIALAKLLDSLYDEEYEDDDVEQKGKNVDRGGDQQQQQQRQKQKKRGGRDWARSVLTTQ